MKNLNRVLLTAGLALTCLPAWADRGEPGYDHAKVVSATPMDTFLHEDDALMKPLFLDHRGRFQAMVAGAEQSAERGGRI